MILQNKTAVIYGAGGSLGGAISKAMAAAGAKVFLTGLHRASVQKIREEIVATGGLAEADEVDALDDQAIDTHLEKLVQKTGKLDISFNATGTRVVQNIPLITMSAEDFMGPVRFMVESQFLTATAAGKRMRLSNSGVILSLTATPGGIGYPYTGGFAPACAAIESFSRNLAAELGIYGIRVVNMRSAGSPDSRVFREAIESIPAEMEIVLKKMEADTMLKKLPMMADIANLAVFLSSHMAGKITGITVDVTSGTTAGLNYKVVPQSESREKQTLTR